MKPRRSLKATPLHPLRGQTLHPIAKLSQRYRPKARALEARIVETKLGIALDAAFRRIAEGIAEGMVRHACGQLAVGAAFIHAVDRIAGGPANSVQPNAETRGQQ